MKPPSKDALRPYTVDQSPTGLWEVGHRDDLSKILTTATKTTAVRLASRLNAAHQIGMNAGIEWATKGGGP